MTDETTGNAETSLRCAAFEAAYLDMPRPDPASHRFVLLVAEYEERLRREWVPMNGWVTSSLRGGGADLRSD